MAWTAEARAKSAETRRRRKALQFQASERAKSQTTSRGKFVKTIKGAAGTLVPDGHGGLIQLAKGGVKNNTLNTMYHELYQAVAAQGPRKASAVPAYLAARSAAAKKAPHAPSGRFISKAAFTDQLKNTLGIRFYTPDQNTLSNKKVGALGRLSAIAALQKQRSGRIKVSTSQMVEAVYRTDLHKAKLLVK